MTVSQWADQKRKLSAESSPEPGQWHTSRNEPQRGIMDSLSEPTIHTVVAMTSSQIGKTETLLNAIGYYVDQDPAPILVIMPTLELGEALSKDRIAPMIRDTACLKGKIRDARTRDSGNTLLHKTFPGGHLTIAGANAPSSLSSRPVRIVLADEVDRYPPSAGTEGDPVSLARRRTSRFWNKKIVLTSTPGTKGISRIEAEWELSDKRFYFVVCLDCGHPQRLVWKQVQWEEHDPDSAVYVCEGCGLCWDDGTRWRAIAQSPARGGGWKATARSRGIAGFHLNEIYAPSPVLLRDMVAGFLDAKKSVQTLRTWVNTSLGESFEETAEAVDGHGLMARRELWGADSPTIPEDQRMAPMAVLVVVAGVDMQGDRCEIERIGYGVDDESWSLEYKIIHGDPSTTAFWDELDRYLLTPTLREDGVELPVAATCIDSGGHHTQQVYKFAKVRYKTRRVYAIKGPSQQQPGTPVWPKRSSKTRKELYLIGTNAGKDATYGYIKVATPGPGYCHFPTGREQVYFDQLTSEKVRTRYIKGFPYREWFLPPSVRNEALDCRVYGYAALQSLNPRWAVLKQLDDQRVGRKRPAQKPVEEAEKSAPVESQEQAAQSPRASVPSPARPVLTPIRRGRGVARRSRWMD